MCQEFSPSLCYIAQNQDDRLGACSIKYESGMVHHRLNFAREKSCQEYSIRMEKQVLYSRKFSQGPNFVIFATHDQNTK